MNRVRRWVFALPTLLALAAAGCSLGFRPSDYEDDTDEGDDAAAVRDGGGANSDATLDAGAAADASDATFSSDATSPPGDAAFVDAPVLRFCQEHLDAAFCSDFDEAGAIDQDWLGNDTTSAGGATLSLDDTTFVSAPTSAQAMIRALEPDAAPVAGAHLVKEIATAPREVLLDFDFRVEQLSGYHLTFVSLYFVGNESRGMYLALADNEPDLLGFNFIPNLADSSTWGFYDFPYPVDGRPQWNHVQIDMVVASDGTGKLSASVNGAVAKSLTGLTFDSDPAANKLRLTVGVDRTATTVTPTMDVHFDNVLLSYPP
jgi:hypothetical protein